MDWIRDNITNIVLGVVGVLLVPVLLRMLLSGGRNTNRPVKAYCNHCNWEGQVTPKKWSCKRCKATDLHVIST